MKNKISLQKAMLFLLVIFSVFFVMGIKQEIIAETSNEQVTLTFENEVDSCYTLMETIRDPWYLNIWHSSGGYWKVGQEKVYDNEIDNNIVENLEEVVLGKGVPLEVEYPEKIKKAINEGKKVVVQLRSYGFHPIEKYLNNTDNADKYSFTNKGNSFDILAYPKFNYQKDEFGEIITYDRFGLDLGFKFPFVGERFGSNAYSIWNRYKGGQPGGGECSSYSEWGEKPEQNKIHPLIINPDGTLKSGYKIETVPTGLLNSEDIKIGHGTFNSGGAVGFLFISPFEYRFYVENENKSDVILRKLELVDPETGKVLESFVRTVDNLDPFNLDKQKLIRTNITPFNASILKRDKDYTVRAEYQYISFEEGSFDISNIDNMTEEQMELKTGIIPNELDRMYAYDDKWDKDGIFDETGTEFSKNKPYTELKNLETAIFEWNFKVPEEAKKYIKIAGKVPKIFTENEIDMFEENNWGLVFARVEPIDIGMHKNVRLINENNETTKLYRKDELLRVIFPVEHVLGDVDIGTHSTNNPKVIVNVEVFDENNTVIYKERLQTDKILKPKSIIDMPITKPFKTKSNKITICGTIDIIHKEKGYNDNEENDKICVTFKAGGNDIGMVAPIELLRGGKSVKFVEKNISHTAVFHVKHCYGDKPIGLDPVKNPKVKLNVSVRDGNNIEILKDSVQAGSVLYPGETIKIPFNKNFGTDTGKFFICATIDPIHAKLGYNDDESNDTLCAPFMGVKNYAVRDLKAVPMSIHFAKNETQLEVPISLMFTITSEDHHNESGEQISSNPLVTIKHGDKIIWEQNVLLPPNQSREMSINFVRNIEIGNNKFSVEINPYRTIKEYMPGMDNPYIDNKKTTSILGVKYNECEECYIRHTENNWKEEWNWHEHIGERVYSTCTSCDKDGNCTTYSCSWCETVSDTYWSEIHSYFETFEIKHVYFRSKWTKDNNLGKNGWLDVKNGGTGKIKAGYGFELKVITNYYTNRNKLPSPSPYNSDCSYQTRSPGLTPIDSPNEIYMKMPYYDREGERVCYILEPTGSTVWYNNDKTFELPFRSSFGIRDERKIYINENAKPQTRRIDICTPRQDGDGKFYGYYPENQVGNGKKSPSEETSYLHDCTHFYIEILPQDDMKTHIIQ